MDPTHLKGAVGKGASGRWIQVTGVTTSAPPLLLGFEPKRQEITQLVLVSLRVERSGERSGGALLDDSAT